MAEAVEEAVADGAAPVLLAGQHGLVDEPGDGFEDVVGGAEGGGGIGAGAGAQVFVRAARVRDRDRARAAGADADAGAGIRLGVRAHAFRGLQVEAAGQDGGAGPDGAFLGGAEVMAPVDGRAQRPMARLNSGAGGGKEAVAVVEAFQELVDAENAQPDGGEFDGERKAVETVAEAGHGGAVRRGEREARDHGGGTVGEQGEGRVRGGVGEVAVWVGHREGAYLQEVFLGERQTVTARGEDPDAGGAAQQGGDEVGAGGQQVFAVVEDQEETAVAYVPDDRVERGARGERIGQTERLGGGREHQGGVVQIGEVDEADAVREGPLSPGG